MNMTIEHAAVFFSVVYVLLAVNANFWCWASGIVAAALYIVFDLELKYYQDAILQLYYVFAGIYGMYLWRKHKDNLSTELKISKWKWKEHTTLLAVGLVLFPLFGFAFSKFGNSFPYLDAFTTVFSFIATYLTAQKILESWLMWIALDLIFIAQYHLKMAEATAILYLFYVIISVMGYLRWQKIMTDYETPVN